MGNIKRKQCIRACTQCANSDHPVSEQRVIRVFALHSCILYYSMILLADSEPSRQTTSKWRDHVASTLIRRHFNVVCPLGRPWTDSVDAQADLCLFCSHMPEDAFCMARPNWSVLNLLHVLYQSMNAKRTKNGTLRKHTYANMWKISPPKTENFQIKTSDIFHISAQNIDCMYSLEPPQWGGSNEYPQSMFLSRNKKNNVYPCKPKFYFIKVGFKGVKII